MVVLIACHGSGKSAVPESCTRATRDTVMIEVCEQHCDAGSAAACGTAATKYSRGIGVKRNVKKSFQLGVRGCELGDADACEVASLIYSGDYDVVGATFKDEAACKKLARRQLELLERDCDASDGDACDSLSFWYREDRYVPIYVAGDPARAAELAARSVRLHRQACDGGDGYACSQVASDIPNDGEKLGRVAARQELYRRACALGHAPSCSLAGLGEPGLSGEELLRRGCDLGDSSSCSDVASFLRLRGATDDAASFETRACDLRDWHACQKLGTRLRDTDPGAARIAFQKACELGDDDSCVQR